MPPGNTWDMAPQPPDCLLPGLFLSCPQNTTRSFNSLLNSISLWEDRDKQEVESAVTVLLQSVELAALATALRSPERTTQTVTTESLGEGGRVALSATCWLLRDTGFYTVPQIHWKLEPVCRCGCEPVFSTDPEQHCPCTRK